MSEKTYRVVQQNWHQGYSLHGRMPDVMAFVQAYYDKASSSPTQTVRGIAFWVNVDKATYDRVKSSQYGVWY